MTRKGPPPRKYGEPTTYEHKLARVMARLEVEDYSFNWDRHGAWVQFRHRGQLYAFEHTVERAKTLKGPSRVIYGSDCFAQLVFALEDIARLVERGIYELQTWVAGLKALPPAPDLPEWCLVMGFAETPQTLEAVRGRYNALLKTRHPDHGGSSSEFIQLQEAWDRAQEEFREGIGGR